MYNILTHWRVLVNSCTVSELCPALTIVLFEADGHQNTELQNIKWGAACPISKALKNILWFILVTLFVFTAVESFVWTLTCTCFGNSHSRMSWTSKQLGNLPSCLTIFSQHPPTNKQVSLFMSKCTITSKQFTTIFRIPWPRFRTCKQQLCTN